MFNFVLLALVDDEMASPVACDEVATDDSLQRKAEKTAVLQSSKFGQPTITSLRFCSCQFSDQAFVGFVPLPVTVGRQL